MARKDENANGKVRLNLELSAPLAERLGELEQTTHESKSGVIRQAVQLYEYVVRRSLDGYTFKAVDRNGREETIVFFGPFIPSFPSRNQIEEEISV